MPTERAIPDSVAAHDHIGGARHVDGVAVLAGPAGTRVDVLDTVVDHDGAVVARRRAPRDGVARNQQSRLALICRESDERVSFGME
jgi:hypothetical protein